MKGNVANSKKILGAFSLAMINIIAIDGIRALPFSAEYGFSSVFYYLVAAILFFIPTSLVTAELASAFPNKGGIYVWVREALGERWAFLVIWLQWIYNVVWYPSILSSIAAALAFLIDPSMAENKIYILSVITVVFWGATFLNCLGMRVSSSISTICALLGSVIPMILIILLGFKWLLSGNPLQITFSTQTFFPDFHHLKNISFLLPLVFGLVGIEVSAVHADEVHDPGKAYPRAIFSSAALLIVGLILASLAIAIVVPMHQLNVVTGIVQAFHIFLARYQLDWLQPMIIALIIIGGVGGVAALIIGPTKGLLVASKDIHALKGFQTTNNKGVPTTILFVQAIIFTLLSSVFLFMPSVSSSYWILTAITSQLSLMVYIPLFIAVIHLRKKRPDVHRPFKIPGGKVGIWICGLVGLISSVAFIGLGFIPPDNIPVGNLKVYEVIVALSIITLCSPAFLLHNKKPSRERHITLRENLAV